MKTLIQQEQTELTESSLLKSSVSSVTSCEEVTSGAGRVTGFRCRATRGVFETVGVDSLYRKATR